MSEKWLIRLMDCENEKLIAAYFTENPSENLKTFYFCKEHDLGIHIPKNAKEERDEYKDKTSGSIYEIEVGFGNEISYSYINIWLEDVH